MQSLFIPFNFIPISSTNSISKTFTPIYFRSSSVAAFAASFSDAQALQSETLTTIEWPTICRHLAQFASTSMAREIATCASIPIGLSQEESQKLLDQTGAALEVITDSGILDFSSVEDINAIVDSAVSGQLLTLGELCTVRRTLGAAKEAFQLLSSSHAASSVRRYSSLIEVLERRNFHTELMEKIGFCIDSNLSIILDRASEELEMIRIQRKQNMEKLEEMLKSVSYRIFQAGGIDRPLVTKRRSRLCVGIRATHRFLIPGGVVLDTSSSGASYFMEPFDAIELNNIEVLLGNSEKQEEVAILSMLTSEIAEASKELKLLLDGIVEIDLAFARAAHAQWIGGTCPMWTSESVDIEGICHPILLESTRGQENGNNSVMVVPINIKVKGGTRVVVISGPNTGGKTASMKTLGVASLMSKAGLYLPARGSPKLPWFDLVLADIGDYQSLERSLSTFSGHISQIRKILAVATENSLVLIDEICSGTDPSEGIALSTSILQHLKNRVNLAVVTTHYADLSRLKDTDIQFENAAMEFSVESLLPTYQIIWGSAGESNALSIAKSIGFNGAIVDSAKAWVDKLTPELQQQRKGFLYQSLMAERNRLEAECMKVSSLHDDIMKLHHEMKSEAEDLETREKALISHFKEQLHQEIESARSQIHSVIHEFEQQAKISPPNHANPLVKKADSAIKSILQAHQPHEIPPSSQPATSSYTPGQQVLVKSLGEKLATVVRSTDDDEEILVKYGRVRVRVRKADIQPAENQIKGSPSLDWKKQMKQFQEESNPESEMAYAPRVKTSKNTVDLRGMRVEEACHFLEMAIGCRGSKQVMFVVHGVGTGAVRRRVLEILARHPRIAEFEPEAPTNFGCTVAYIK